MADNNLKPIVVCGPSGVGKGTLIDLLMKERFVNNQLGFSVSHTTRQPREGEIDGKHYNFTTVEQIQKDIEAGKFIEYANVHGKYYGTSIQAVESVQASGKVCILDIDIQGAQSVKESSLDATYIFIAPPSMEELESRLRGRGTEKEEQIQTRLGNAQKELDYGREPGNFEAVFTNNDLHQTLEEIVAFMKERYPDLIDNKMPLLKPIVVCGPSGVGKGTLIDLLMKRFPNNQLGFSVSHTTRQPREGEIDGKHYNFTTVEQIQEDIKDGKFIEYANVHGKYYGTSIAAVESVQADGKVCILDIDIQGAQSVKKSSLKAIYIFIAPPSMQELEKRLRGRGTEKEEQILTRLGNAQKELDYGQAAGNFDRIFVNADLKETMEEIVLALREWYPHLIEMAPDDEQKSCTSCVVS